MNSPKEVIEIFIFMFGVIIDYFVQNPEVFISIVAVSLSGWSLIYNYFKNKDFVQIIFKHKLKISISTISYTKPNIKKYPPTAEDYEFESTVHFETDLTMLNASNHNVGYYDFELIVYDKGEQILRLPYLGENTGNILERSHNTFSLSFTTKEEIEHLENLSAFLSVKIITRKFWSNNNYVVKGNEFTANSISLDNLSDPPSLEKDIVLNV